MRTSSFARLVAAIAVPLGATLTGCFVDRSVSIGNRPYLTTLEPSAIVAGGPSLTLTIHGHGFLPSDVVAYLGGQRSGTFVNSEEMTMLLNASDYVNAGMFGVEVYRFSGGSGVFDELYLVVTNPVPVLTSIAPTSVPVGGNPAPSVALTGSGFGPESQVLVGGAARATTYTSATQLTVYLAVSDVAAAGTLAIQVKNPPPKGGLSAVVTLKVGP